MSQKFKTRALKCFPCLTDQQNEKHNIRTFTTLTARNTRQPDKGNLMRLQECFTGMYNRMSRNAQVVGSTAELVLELHDVQSSQSSCDRHQAVQARMERLAKLQERFTGKRARPQT